MQVDDLILTKSLGKGAFGEVFLTTKQGSKEYYATKRLDRAFSEKPENIKRLANEISLLKKINHPNIVKLIDLKKTKSHCYIVMEYCNGGDLSGCLKKYKAAYKRPFPEEVVQYIMRQVVSGIAFLHSHKIMHRDLKLDNILVTFNSESDKNSLNMMKAIVKIIDFGFATRLKSDLTFTVLGTPANMDPQILSNMQSRTPNPGYDEKADIWSLGTLCYEMLVGHMAFSGQSMQELTMKVKQGTYFLPTNLSKEVVSFIEGMLQKDPKQRLSAQELAKHDFLVKNVRQFQNLDTRKIPGVVQNGGFMTVNANQGNKVNKLHETVWDIFAQPMPSVPKIPTSNQPYGIQMMAQPQMQVYNQGMYSRPQMQMGQQQYVQQPGFNKNMYGY